MGTLKKVFPKKRHHVPYSLKYNSAQLPRLYYWHSNKICLNFHKIKMTPRQDLLCKYDVARNTRNQTNINFVHKYTASHEGVNVFSKTVVALSSKCMLP